MGRAYNLPKTILITGGEGQLGLSLYLSLKDIFNVFNTSKTPLNHSVQLDVSSFKNVKDSIEKIEEIIFYYNMGKIKRINYEKQRQKNNE